MNHIIGGPNRPFQKLSSTREEALILIPPILPLLFASCPPKDTAGAFLMASIATKKPEPPSSGSTDVAPIELGESYSNLHYPLPLADNHAQNLVAGPSNDPEPLVEQQQEEISNEDSKHLQLHTAIEVKTHRKYTEIKESGTVEILHSQINANDVHEGKETLTNEMIDKKNDIKSTDIHLSIRMPSGSSLQAKFIASDRLRSAKNYVDDNNSSMIGSYDLAIPYPRKVFGEEDMNKSLAELGFAGRQAVIVIPKRQVPGLQRGLLSNDIQTSANQTNSNDSALGYFGYLKSVLSYMNPFSYLSGSGRESSSTSEQAPNDGLRQYRPNPGLQNSLSGRETVRSPYPSTPQNSATGGNASILGRTSRLFGSNIHTLRQDEGDFRSDDRNTFWNGNSTQFGGNDK